MTQWYETAFGAEYLALYAHRNDAEAGLLTDLILRETSLTRGARVLDAPCGAGRHMRAFDEAGFAAFGFDLSPELLQAAKDAGTRPSSFVRGDLRHIPFKAGRFDLVVNLFSSLGYFPEDATNYAVIHRLVDLCRPGGWLVIDFMNRRFLTDNLRPESERTMANGTHVRDRRWIDGEPPRVNKETTLTYPDGNITRLNESVRLFTAGELRAKLSECGLRVEKEFGGYDGAAFDEATSQRIILMGRRQ